METDTFFLGPTCVDPWSDEEAQAPSVALNKTAVTNDEVFNIQNTVPSGRAAPHGRSSIGTGRYLRTLRRAGEALRGPSRRGQ